MCKERSVMGAWQRVVVLLQIPSVHRGEGSQRPGLPLWWWCKDWTEWTPVSSSGQTSSGENHSFAWDHRWFCRWHSDNRRACKGRATAIAHLVRPSRWVPETVSEMQHSQELIAFISSVSSPPFGPAAPVKQCLCWNLASKLLFLYSIAGSPRNSSSTGIPLAT